MGKDPQMKRESALKRQTINDAMSIDEKIKRAQGRPGNNAKELSRLYKLKAEGIKK